MKKNTVLSIITFLLSVIVFGQNTYVPDDNFEQALIDLGHDSGPLDDYVPTANISTIDNLNVAVKNISDLTGIEDFVGLLYLNCSSNTLTSLDLSNNTTLTSLFCNSNFLMSLDVSNNTALTTLTCYSNLIPSLDVSSNTELIYLSCHINSLTSLDVSNNTALTSLLCHSNFLTSLNVKNGNNTAITSFDSTSNLNLTCIDVDDVNYSTTHWFNVDSTSSFSVDCFPFTYVPDDNFEQALIDLGYDSGVLDDYVSTPVIEAITSLNIQNKNISDLTGIEDFVALTDLNCSSNNLTSLDVNNNTTLKTLYFSYNNLTSIDVSNNTALEKLYCIGNNLTSIDVSLNTALTNLSCSLNNLTSLDVSNNTALEVFACSFNYLTSLGVSNNTVLEVLFCSNNNLTSLDVSNNTVFQYLSCENNYLTSLDVSNNTTLNQLICNDNILTNLNVKNGNNTNFSNFNATNNPNLTCVEVDDVTYSTTNWTDIDSASSFSEDCYPFTYIPDDNFEQALIDLGYDIILDNYVITASVNTITTLNLNNKNILDLTGIEDFVALTHLNCANNLLTNLDVSFNTLLIQLNCYSNKLSNIDVSLNQNLTNLQCYTNIINVLNLNQNTALTNLNCSNNQIISLDLSLNTKLAQLTCNINQLTSLNVKNGNNTNVTLFNSANNPNLACIEVDDANYSTANWTGIDPASSFSENCSTLSVDVLNKDAFLLYPNPVSNQLIISTKIDGRFSIINVNGQTLKQGGLINGDNKIEMLQLKAGLYFLKIETENGFILKKVIKK